MKKKKSLIVEHDFFWKKSPLLDVFWPRPVLKANHGTVRKSAIFSKPSDQKQLKWSNTAYVNKWSLTFKIKLCVFRVTKTLLYMKVIRIFNAQVVKIPHFKRPLTCKQARWPHFFSLHFFKFHIMNVNHAKFQKMCDSRTISRE